MWEAVVTSILSKHILFESVEISDAALAEISLTLEMHRDFRMSVYKDKCMKRRIAIRMRSCRCNDAAAYCALLRQNDHELDLLKKALTIHVSQFFRNPAMFKKLQTAIFPYLFQKAEAAQEPLRLWSLGCAGGEEAYSLGILLREFFSGQLMHTSVEIYGADIDADTLQAAIHAEYIEDRLKEVPTAIRERYFISNGPRLLLTSEIRDMVTFHQRDIMAVETYEPCLMALCRNTLIYFNRPDQEKILLGIAHILPSGGILVLGKSETLVGDARKLFTTVCPVERIYCRL